MVDILWFIKGFPNLFFNNQKDFDEFNLFYFKKRDTPSPLK